MAISNGELERKKAIVDRVQQILDNAKNIDRYSVREFIIPEADS